MAAAGEAAIVAQVVDRRMLQPILLSPSHPTTDASTGTAAIEHRSSQRIVVSADVA
jgi:hypothetical protein